MKILNHFYIKIRQLSLLMVLMLFSFSPVFAQCSDPYNPNPDFPPCNPDVNVPVDDGVYVLIGAVLLVGFYAFKTKKNVLPA